MQLSKITNKFFYLLLLMLFVSSCGIYKKTDARSTPYDGQERALKNIKEGRGASIGKLRKGLKGGMQYEFSTSNPLWRASLDVLDFMPLATIDYSGGMIISDWYQDKDDNKNSLKISLRFLSNEVTATSLKITVHQKTCVASNNCITRILKNSKINEELLFSIVKKAVLIQKDQKK